MALTHHYDGVLSTFEGIQNELSELKTCLDGDEMLVSWLHYEPNLAIPIHENATHRETVFAILSQLEYLDSQDPREILIHPGFVGASDDTLKSISKLNEAKEAFKEAMLQLSAQKLSTKNEAFIEAIEKTFTLRSQKTASTLKKIGLSRLHLKQCYRKIPILPHAPLKITWTWAHTRAINKITVQEAEKMLRKRKLDHGIEKQLLLLSYLSPQEPLAIVQELAPHLRANILFPHDAERHRMMIKGPIPIFFPANASTPCPEFKTPLPKQLRNTARMTRNDVRLEPTPFLPAIRAHRYTNEKEVDVC